MHQQAAFFTTEDFFDRQAGKFVPGFFDFIELSVCMKQVGTLGFLKFNFLGRIRISLRFFQGF